MEKIIYFSYVAVADFVFLDRDVWISNFFLQTMLIFSGFPSFQNHNKDLKNLIWTIYFVEQ